MSIENLDGSQNLDNELFQDLQLVHKADEDNRWWRSSVIYQIYPKSFRDASGDGIGDIPGITGGLAELSDLGVDAIWLSPFYTSPQKDGGYDVTDYCGIDPVFGTIEDFEAMTARANELGLKVIIDLVPNHCSIDNAFFQEAIQSEAGSPARDMFIFRDGKGEHGELPPNNWQSHFEGPAWTRITEPNGTPGQWYLHLFDSSQPDWNWDNPAVHAEFERILRFWLDRGVTGFRVDVAHALVKKSGLPDWGGRADGNSMDGFPGADAPMFGQPAVHDIYREWRRILDEYDGDRILCAEANVDPLPRMAEWVRDDEMHQAFNFSYLHSGWNPNRLKEVIDTSLEAFDAVGAPTTWVLSNHDIIRHASRFGLDSHGDGIGPNDPQPDSVLGLSRARAASMLMLALPGGCYLYQGEELGLPDNTMMEPQYRQDPSFFRSEGERIGRDGCRVPLPWTEDGDSYGFSPTGQTWLPQPEEWAKLSRQNQWKDHNSTLNMYSHVLELRKHFNLGSGSLSWAPALSGQGSLAFVNNGVLVIINMGQEPVEVPALKLLASSEEDALKDGKLGVNRAVWMSVK